MAFAVTPKIITVHFYKQNERRNYGGLFGKGDRVRLKQRDNHPSVKCGIERSSDGGKKGGGGGGGVSNSNYVVPLDNFSNSSCINRPLAEILRDLNKRIPDTIVKGKAHDVPGFIPWYHANRMLSFYAPGWCGEIRDVIFSDNGSVTVVYRLTLRGSDGEAYRESTGTISPSDGSNGDPVSAAEEIAFCKACARFGLGLYLYHEDQMTSF